MYNICIMNDEKRDKKCGRCKCWRKSSQFISKNRDLKTCDLCRELAKKWREENKEHLQKYEDTHKDERKKWKENNVNSILIKEA